MTFAPSGDVVVTALRALDRGGTVAINAIHLDRIPEFSYASLWSERSIRSVANLTRDDARELLDLAADIGIHTATQAFPLDQANEAIQGLAEGTLDGTAVLVANEGWPGRLHDNRPVGQRPGQRHSGSCSSAALQDTPRHERHKTDS